MLIVVSHVHCRCAWQRIVGGIQVHNSDRAAYGHQVALHGHTVRGLAAAGRRNDDLGERHRCGEDLTPLLQR